MNRKNELTGGVEPTLMQHAGREPKCGRKGRAGPAREDRTSGATRKAPRRNLAESTTGRLLTKVFEILNEALG